MSQIEKELRFNNTGSRQTLSAPLQSQNFKPSWRHYQRNTSAGNIPAPRLEGYPITRHDPRHNHYRYRATSLADGGSSPFTVEQQNRITPSGMHPRETTRNREGILKTQKHHPATPHPRDTGVRKKGEGKNSGEGARETPLPRNTCVRERRRRCPFRGVMKRPEGSWRKKEPSSLRITPN